MTAYRLALTCLQLTTAVLTLIACAPADGPDNQPSTTAPASGAGSSSRDPQSPIPTRPPNQEDAIRVVITISDQRFQASLAESAATRGLLDQLPVTVQMTDHGAVEKTGRLPMPLSLAGQPAGADPNVGGIGYYAPGQDLVLYYGDQSYYEGIVVLGQMADDAAQRIADIDGPVTATVEALDD